jgi:hypothetical protein
MGTPRPPSLIWTLAVDAPLAQDAGFQDNATYRSYVDSQVRGCETHLVDSLVGGVVATWRVLDSSAGRSAVLGDVVCLAGMAQETVTFATGTAIAAAHLVLGIVLSPSAPGGAIQIALLGVLPPTVTGLPIAGNLAFAVLDSGSQRIITKSTIGVNDYVIGAVDVAGNLTLRPQLPPATGSGGISISGTGVALVASGVIQGAAGTIDLSSSTYVANVLPWAHGGRLQGHIAVTHSATGALDATHQIAWVDSSTGTTTTQLPASPVGDFPCMIADTGGQAGANAITVDPQGAHIWDPRSQSFVTTSVVFDTNGVVIVYQWDSAKTHWVLVSGAPQAALTAGQILVGQSASDPLPKTVSGDATLAASGALTFASTGVSPGTYGDHVNIPVVTIDAKGRVTSAATTPIGGAGGSVPVASGGTGQTSLTAHGVLVGEGTAALDAVVLGDGQILVGQTGADPLAKTVSGDGTLADTGAFTLAATGVGAASYGDGAHVSQLTVNAKGLITAASSVSIALTNANLISGAFTHIVGVGTLTAGATGSGFTIDFGVSTISGQLAAAHQQPQSLSGDVIGTTDSNTSVAIRNVTVPSLSTGFLRYQGGAFAWHALVLGDLGASGASTGQYPSWNGSAWVPATLPGQGPTAWAGTITDFVFGNDVGVWQDVTNTTVTAPADGFAMVLIEFLYKNRFATGTAVVSLGIGTSSASPNIISRGPVVLPPPSAVTDSPNEGDLGVTLSQRVAMTEGETLTFYALTKVDNDYGLTLRAEADISVIYVTTSLGGGGGGGGLPAGTGLVEVTGGVGSTLSGGPGLVEINGSNVPSALGGTGLVTLASGAGGVIAPAQAGNVVTDTGSGFASQAFARATLASRFPTAYPNIFIDPTAGSDANPGTSGSPIKTTAFLRDRLFMTRLTANTTLQYLSDEVSADGLDYSTVDLAGFSLTISQTPVILHTGGTLNAGTTAINPAAGGGGQRQLAHTSDLADFSPYVIAAFGGAASDAVRLVDTAGPNLDTGAWIASTIGHTVATANLVRPVTPGFAVGTLTSGDGYKLTRGGILRLSPMTPPPSSKPGGSVVINDCAFTSDSVGANGAIYHRCSYQSAIQVSGTYIDCYGGSGFFDSGSCGASSYSGGLLNVNPGDSYHSQLFVDSDCYITGGTLELIDFTYSSMEFSPGIGSGVQIHDMTDTGGAITMGQVAQPVGIGSPNALIWGNGNLGAGINMLAGAVLTVDHLAPPTITGTAGDFAFTNKSGGIITVGRGIDDTGSAPVYTTLRTTSWSNFAAALGSGGFNFGAHCVDTGAAIVGS